jgi:hypothetical protein
MAAQGAAMLSVFHAEAQPRNIAAVEYPFAVPLTDPDTGKVLDFTLVGVVDLIESDDEGAHIVVELKTAAARMSDNKAAGLLDGLLYAYALDQLGVRTTPTRTLVRVDIMLKGDPSGFQQMYINHDAGAYEGLVRWIMEILDAIAAGSFPLLGGWPCKSCEFKKSCDDAITHKRIPKHDYDMDRYIRILAMQPKPTPKRKKAVGSFQ